MIFDDGLAGSKETRLDAHIPDTIGTGWTSLDSSGPQIILTGSGGAKTDSKASSSSSLYSADPAPSAADVDIIFDMVSLDGSDDDTTIVVFRYQDTTDITRPRDVGSVLSNKRHSLPLGDTNHCAMPSFTTRHSGKPAFRRITTSSGPSEPRIRY